MSLNGIRNDKLYITHAMKLANEIENTAIKKIVDLKRKKEESSRIVAEAAREFHRLDEALRQLNNGTDFPKALEIAEESAKNAPANKKAKRQKELDRIKGRYTAFINNNNSVPPCIQAKQNSLLLQEAAEKSITVSIHDLLCQASSVAPAASIDLISPPSPHFVDLLNSPCSPNKSAPHSPVSPVSSSISVKTNLFEAPTPQCKIYSPPNAGFEEVLKGCNPQKITRWINQIGIEEARKLFVARTLHPLTKLVEVYEGSSKRPAKKEKTRVMRENNEKLLVEAWHILMNDFAIPYRPFTGNIPAIFQQKTNNN